MHYFLEPSIQGALSPTQKLCIAPQWLLQGEFPNFLAWPTKLSLTQLTVEVLSPSPSRASNTTTPQQTRGEHLN